MISWSIAARDEPAMLPDPAVSAPVPEPEPEPTLAEAFEELEAILYEVASSPPQQRKHAVRYMKCRDILLADPVRSVLPGFMLQTGTVDKFRDFITLYDRDVRSRHAFLDHALSRCRALIGPKRARDPFDDLDF